MMIQNLTKIALEAGQIIMPYWRSDLDLRQKPDLSPVTLADEEAEAHIIQALRHINPHIPIIAEEAMSRSEAVHLADQVFYVDPLDGTKEFINGRAEFTVNIALVNRGLPIMGVVYAPALGLAYIGSSHGAFKLEIQDGMIVGTKAIKAQCPSPDLGLIVVGSASHESDQTKAFLETLSVASYQKAGSSLKFCHIAEGMAHIYPRFGRTMTWDTAAGHAVLNAAGGRVTLCDGVVALDYRPELKSGPESVCQSLFLRFLPRFPAD